MNHDDPRPIDERSGSVEPRHPAEPSRILDEDIAMLSGGLFDSLPRVEVPLETFFPAEYHGSPAWHRARSDSLFPVVRREGARAASAASSRRPSPGWFVGVATAAVIVLMAVAVLRRPPAPAAAAQPTGTAEMRAEPPAAPEAPAVESRSPRKQVSCPMFTQRIQTTTPAPTVPPTPRARAEEPDLAPTRAPVHPRADPPGSEPVLENMPIAITPPQGPPPPEVPPQQRTAIAIATSARGAAGCFAPGELRRTMAVSVTFAPSGRATRAVIEGGPHRATPVGSCIALHLRTAAVRPFEGPAVTVHTSVHIR